MDSTTQTQQQQAKREKRSYSNNLLGRTYSITVKGLKRRLGWIILCQVKKVRKNLKIRQTQEI
jgi:hypothetical protein